MKKLKVNKDACISCGACVSCVPDVFTFGDDDKAEVKINQIPENLKEDILDAVEGCPTSAILYDDDKAEDV